MVDTRGRFGPAKKTVRVHLPSLERNQTWGCRSLNREGGSLTMDKDEQGGLGHPMASPSCSCPLCLLVSTDASPLGCATPEHRATRPPAGSGLIFLSG